MTDADPPLPPLVKYLELIGTPAARGRSCPVCGQGAPCRVGFYPNDPTDSRPIVGFCTSIDVMCEFQADPEDWQDRRGWRVNGGEPVVAYATSRDKGVRGIVCVLALPGDKPGTVEPVVRVEIPIAPDPRDIYKAEGIRLARKIWDEASQQTDDGNAAVRAYFAGRGIPVERLPGFEDGQIPRVLRFHPRCFIDKVADKHGRTSPIYGPAILARLEEVKIEKNQARLSHVGLQRYFLKQHEVEPARWGKRTMDGDDSAKKMIGSCQGRTVWTHKPDSFPRRALLVGEGLETLYACMAATGLSGQPALSAGGIRALKWYDHLFRPRNPGEAPPVSCVILCSDLNKSRLHAGQWEAYVQRLCADAPGLAAEEALAIAQLPTGQRACAAQAAIVRARWPWITTVVRWPTAERFPELVKLDQRAMDEQRLCVDRPAGDDSVDWLNCLNLHLGGDVFEDPPVGDLEDRLRRVREALLDGVDLELAEFVAREAEPIADKAKDDLRERARRAIGTRDAHRPRSEEIGRADPTGMAPPAEKAPSNSPTAATGGSGDSGRGGGPAVEVDGSDPDPERLKAWQANIDAARALYRWPVDGFADDAIDPAPRHRARLFLLEKCLDVGGTRFRLLHWATKFYWCESTRRGAWREMGPDELFGWIQEWLLQFLHVRELKTKSDPQPVRANAVDVNEIILSLRAEIQAAFEGPPVWLPRNVTRDGQPLWARAGQRMSGSEVIPGEGWAKDWMVHTNGRLDMKSLRARRAVVMHANTPELFTVAARGYELRVDWLREGLASAGRFTPAWFAANAPCFGRLLDLVGKDVFHRPRHDRDDFLLRLRHVFGDAISSDRTIEKIPIFPGYTRTGKDTLQRALRAAVGKESVIDIGLSDLNDRDMVATLVGKNNIIMPDMHVSGVADNSQPVELLKRIRGNSGVTVRPVYERSVPGVRIPGRIWIFCNDLPENLKDNSNALARSFVVFPLRASVLDNEDGGVKGGIDSEGPAINVWALTGFSDLWGMERPTLVSPPSGGGVSALMARHSSPMGAFAKDCCVLHEEAEINIERLHGMHNRWSEATGRKAMGLDTFTTRLASAVPIGVVTDEETGRPIAFTGIDIRSDLPPSMVITTSAAGSFSSSFGSGSRPAARGDDQYTFPV